MRNRIFLILYSIAFAWTVWPIASVLLTNVIAASLHCRLSEGGPSPCRLLGVDISHQLYVGGVSFWLALTTVPTGVPLLLLLAALHVFLRVKEKFIAHERRE
ncbi:hypothetical protein QYH69_21895 [Paraburkholderia sp. SARCC-3016]|uniref:hypothetical protein n=1 Tax=Paraburkholderia sp. SARCC-3016 TaxID=3058611 RepID=UPI002808568A|nr:hypothetical protein [Paraburkholderia sp. SARCC-3016]MDQ7979896.1 hypothetical protein [Paraburkholderia sp. SARCC-3016]